MLILGISAFYHDSAACLLQDGEIVAAAQEERFSRIKHDAGFPEAAIRYCLQEAGVELHEVDHVVFYEKPFLKFERLLETSVVNAPFGMRFFLRYMPIWLKEKLFQKRFIINRLRDIDKRWRAGDNLLFTTHHQAHAASAFFPSRFRKALVLAVDGVGEWTTTSIWKGEDNRLTLLKELQYPHSLGLLYSAFTYYLGFKVNSDEYKLMGLAPYGKPRYQALILRELITVKPDGSFRINMDYFGYGTGMKMINTRFCRLFGQPPRSADEPITTFHMDIASSIQRVTSLVMHKIVHTASQAYQLPVVCLAGGVALNCVINGELIAQRSVEDLWIQPAAGDAGGALGAAYAVYHTYLNHPRKSHDGLDRMHGALLGPKYAADEVDAELKALGCQYKAYSDDEYCRIIADLISKGKVVGWFNGRMEYGPRALGARSILADARNTAMQSLVNLKVKFRESFRPFAVAMLESAVSTYYHLDRPSPYMLLVSRMKERFCYHAAGNADAIGFDKLRVVRSPLPAVTHVDYSSRIQTVTSRDGLFFKLLKTFDAMTGCPAILNTSFNTDGQPIVCSPRDAIQCFWSTDIDVLAIGNRIVMKTPDDTPSQ
ncbi:carbamoyltransferase family protein [Parapedobacter pyrenivorans]|uniref:carbamoyltransferase family protein n=1 Tax=Parapedobacter pyrenivorans TaxID=1305674 RepID=UPI00333FD724